MTSFMNEFEHLRIQLEEIKRATNSFRNKVIGAGGFGPVYAGEVSHSMGQSIVAIKRLNRRLGQGEPEFMKEIMMLSRYRHPNLISLLGFCDEEGEKVLVYEYAPNQSLDRYLSNPGLTWTQRIKICLGAAKGLSYLHDPRGAHQRVLHCDIKSANILLDENMTAKVADFGLSKMGPANQQNSVLVTYALGTPGYCDPLYMTDYTLTKESDVYSFGVLLFEVLCGRLCYEYSNGSQIKLLVNMWKEKFSENKSNEIVFEDLKPQMHETTLELFSDVAFKCLHNSREGRPTMSIVVEKLEKALELQEFYDRKVPEGYKDMVLSAVPPLMFTSIDDLNELLSNGVYLNAGKTWFSRNDKGVHYVFNSIRTEKGDPDYYLFMYNSRFPEAGSFRARYGVFHTCVKTEFLSPHVTYTVNLVFKYSRFEEKNPAVKRRLICYEYELAGKWDTNHVSHFAYKREDNWWNLELYHFTSDGTTVDLEINFGRALYEIIVDGIEFLPLEKEELQVLEEDQKDLNLEATLSDLEDYTIWENTSPTDYKDIIKFSEQRLQWTTSKELYNILSEGLLINYKPSFSFSQRPTNHGQQWFCLDKNGKRCLMLPARSVCDIWKCEWRSLPESRFGEGLVYSNRSYRYIFIKKSKLRVLSPRTKYACYLVYKTEEGECTCPMQVLHTFSGSDEWKYGVCIYLVSPQTPVIRPKASQITHNPLHRPKLKGLPQQRSDGWMEVQIWVFQTDTTMTVIPRLRLDYLGTAFKECFEGLIINGIEFRPI